ncbi:MAG: hypothetical protein RLZZ608_800 [Actinomycetota bacterium]
MESLLAPSLGTVEMGGTSAAVVTSTSGIADATPIAPEAITPTLSADTAVTAIHVGVGVITFFSRRWRQARVVGGEFSLPVHTPQRDSPR